MKKIKQFVDFAAMHPDAVITYHASNMVLAGHSNASYLSKSNARSRAGGHFFMSKNVKTLPNNGEVFAILQIIKAVMSLAAEAKIGAPYINCHEAVPARHVLESWDINNHPHQCKLTILQHWGLSTRMS